MTEFEEVYRTYFQDVFRYIRRLSGSEHVAEEITAETFFKAMGAMDGFRGECDIRVWLCQIAGNCYRSWLRKSGRLRSMEEGLPLPADPGETVEERVLRREEAGEIRRVLHALSEPYKEVFMWRVFGELSFRQIGQLFGKSENWACVTYHRARGEIKKRWEAEGHEK